MSAARSSVRVLSTLGRAGATSQFRKLHITGPATFPSLLFSTETQARQQLNTTSTSSESSSDSSAAMSSYRQFHSSPISQAVGDSSTIDFMYFPDFDPDFEPETPPRIPLLPSTTLESTSSYYPPEEVESVHLPEIVTASADSTFISSPSPMSEVHDSNQLDYEGLAPKTEKASGEEGGEGKNIFYTVITDMIDDILGPSKKPKSS